MIGVLSAPHLVSLKVSLIHALAVQLLICLILYRLREVDQGQLLHTCTTPNTDEHRATMKYKIWGKDST